VPPLPAAEPGQTNRERVEAHTAEGVCSGCHREVINPAGFSLEGFDAMGQVRSLDADRPVDTSGTYSFEGSTWTFTGAADFVAQMADGPRAHGCYSASLAEFALARDIAGGEQQLVTGMQTASTENDASIKQLLLSVVQSPTFTVAQGGTP
jgi:hypothetical protein